MSTQPITVSLKRRLSETSNGVTSPRGGDGLSSSKTKRRSSKKKRLRREGSTEGEKKLRFNDDAPGEETEEQKEEHERQRLSALLATFTPEQMKRYESFRRSHLDKRKVKKLITNVSGIKVVPDELAVALGGIAKVFAGELIELAREDMNDTQTAIHPRHIRNAFRKLALTGKIPYISRPGVGLLQ
mmetsp:Transcript_18049/g.29277  ORF Transcript_18049/g.29277 Transcript_18049/m.29277 type:complete len:186 (+) Transcript_18049:303-860(+)|eukprot:CAMPEP_0203767518 /NCGR_PEP_ID=MMETSP0099_2-20121227/1047_1 /ASSEMBLY_ACC=CAM_ASM_000209 /TAXON_ID=96639 /ORGANISM=" , Strain NY0313808BC1" /LENGTH=185 /DNA_ID=CAMNT_0050664047 /DNA_START=259 /DNA_END=816 /DNA_ORIENTATION=-